MINLDDRLFSKVNESELWLLCHITKRFGKVNHCWPSNETLMGDTGWSKEKLQKIKLSLLEKGILEIKTRWVKNRQSANYYYVHTNLIGVFVTVDDLTKDGVSDRGSEKPTPSVHQGVGKSGGGEGSEIPTTEVLTREEVLTNNTLQIEICDLKLFSDPVVKQPKKGKGVKPTYPDHQPFKEIWVQHYPNITLKFPRDGKIINDLIEETARQLKLRGTDGDNPALRVEFWGIFVANLNRTWGHNKPLTTINSQYTSLITTLEDGNKKIAASGGKGSIYDPTWMDSLYGKTTSA